MSLRRCYTYMCCIYVTNVLHSKNCFTRDRTTQAVVITKKQNVHTIKRRTFTVQHSFYMFYITNKKNVIIV